MYQRLGRVVPECEDGGRLRGRGSTACRPPEQADCGECRLNRRPPRGALSCLLCLLLLMTLGEVWTCLWWGAGYLREARLQSLSVFMRDRAGVSAVCSTLSSLPQIAGVAAAPGAAPMGTALPCHSRKVDAAFEIFSLLLVFSLSASQTGTSLIQTLELGTCRHFISSYSQPGKDATDFSSEQW